MILKQHIDICRYEMTGVLSRIECKHGSSILRLLTLLSFSCLGRTHMFCPVKRKSKSGHGGRPPLFRGIRSRNSIEFTRLAAFLSRFRAGANGASGEDRVLSDRRGIVNASFLQRHVVVKLYHTRKRNKIKHV